MGALNTTVFRVCNRCARLPPKEKAEAYPKNALSTKTTNFIWRPIGMRRSLITLPNHVKFCLRYMASVQNVVLVGWILAVASHAHVVSDSFVHNNQNRGVERNVFNFVAPVTVNRIGTYHKGFFSDVPMCPRSSPLFVMLAERRRQATPQPVSPSLI